MRRAKKDDGAWVPCWKKGALSLLALLVLAFPASAKGPIYRSRYSRSLALVVGINHYKLWPQLEYAVNDAREVAALLREKGFTVHAVLDRKATRHALLAAIDDILSTADGNTRVFFYFAGHGQTEDLPDGGERGYIVPVDADLYDWKNTMLSFAEIRNRFLKAHMKHAFLAFDSCYSGLGLMRGIAPLGGHGTGYIRKMMRLRCIEVLTAGGRAEKALETAGHGIFTTQLINALSGDADLDKDGYVTGTEIYAYLRPRVTRLSYSRQTPQFGYLEGEGDFVLKARAPKTGTAWIILGVPFGKVNVWVDKDLKKRGLEPGKHLIQVTAGLKHILIKKDARTLFRKTVVLKNGQKFPISLSREPFAYRSPTPSTLVNIFYPGIRTYTNTLPWDLDGDGREECVTAYGDSLYAFKDNGRFLWKKTFGYKVRLDLIDTFGGRPAIAVSGRKDGIIHLILLDGQGREIWHHRRQITRFYQGKPDGCGWIAALADLNGDGKEEVITFTTAGYAWKPRGVIVYDGSGKELWRYLIGPSPKNLVIWKRKDGPPDIILSTYSPGNGNREPGNGTDDMHAYVISLDARGRVNWVQKLGTIFTELRVKLADTDGDGHPELYGYKKTAYKYRDRDEGAVYKFSRNGEILRRFEIGDSIQSLAAPRQFTGKGLLYASDKTGKVYRLDGNLNVLDERNLNASPLPMMVRLVGVHDYNGDGKPELLLYAYNRYQKGHNPRNDMGPRNIFYYANMNYQILSGDLSRVIKRVSIAERWHKWRGFRVIDFKRPEMPRYPFMALSDKITVFNY